MNKNESMVLATRLPAAASAKEHEDFRLGLELMASFLGSPDTSDQDFTFLPNPLLVSRPEE